MRTVGLIPVEKPKKKSGKKATEKEPEVQTEEKATEKEPEK